MSSESILFGNFGRANLLQLSQPLSVHAHREWQLSFLVDGNSANLLSGESSCRVDDNVAGVVQSFAPHSMEIPEPQRPAMCLTLYVDPQWQKYSYPELRNSNTEDAVCSVEVSEDSRKLIRHVVSGMANKKYDNTLQLSIERLISNCFSTLGLNCSRSFRIPKRTGYLAIDRRLGSACDLIMAGVENSVFLSIEEIADRVGMSRALLFRLFREQMGVTPKLYLDTLRLESSIEKLAFTRFPVTTIALDAGFASQPSFSRFFSAIVGVSPSNYRKIAQGVA